MAEAEDVITDAARHATIYARDLWRRHRHSSAAPRIVQLADMSERLQLLVEAVFGVRYPLRIAQAPARPTVLERLFKRHELRAPQYAVPATDGRDLWLPPSLGSADPEHTLQRYRVLCLGLALRAQRGSATIASQAASVPERALFLLLEARVCDHQLEQRLPGLGPLLTTLRREAAERRPQINSLPSLFRPFEHFAQSLLAGDWPEGCEPLAGALRGSSPPHAEDVRVVAQQLCRTRAEFSPGCHRWGRFAVIPDLWTCDYMTAESMGASTFDGDIHDSSPRNTDRSARLIRRPKVREARPNEDDKDPGAWMVQTAEPLEHAEDPMGMQRPVDKDELTSPEEFADSLSELPEARLVSTSQPAREVLLSDDPPEKRQHSESTVQWQETTRLRYPEWDYRSSSYNAAGATVHLLSAPYGPHAWVDAILRRHQSLLDSIRRRFEMLRPERTRLKRQLDGDELDLDAYVEAVSDKRAGCSMSQTLYEAQRPGKRNTAILLLIDISGSTDSWLSADQRIIDVEKEALLLVCAALERVGDPYAVQAFSGEGPQGVTITTVKTYREPYGSDVARRIAGLEPDRYTRAGAALRHATATLMQEPAQHRLLLLLSDGKPNDADRYEGRYGVEDMRQAVAEAKLQGVFPFCLTIDRQAAGYLPAIFGARQYALLPKSEHLPVVLLDWMRRLLVG